MFTAPSQNNNNPSQPRPHNQARIFYGPPDPSGNQPPQLYMMGNTGEGERLIPVPQPLQGLVLNGTQQISDAELIAAMGGSVGPDFDASLAAQNNVELNGTLYLGRGILKKDKNNNLLFAITSKTPYSSDELRMLDYYHLKNNTLKPEQRARLRKTINFNLTYFGCSSIHSHFSSTGLPPNLATLYSENDKPISRGNQVVSGSGCPFMNSKPSQSAQISGELAETKSSSMMERKMFSVSKSKSPSQVVVADQTAKKKPSTGKPAEKQTMESNPGSFNYEFNKMLFVSSLSQIMEKHNLIMPEILLDNTDFVPQLLEFLGKYNINLPTENVPQFQMDSHDYD